MKKLILLAGVVLFLFPDLNAQVDLDRSINLSGSDASDRSITNLSPPVNGTDAANKAYVDAIAGTPSLTQEAIDALTGVTPGTVVHNSSTNCLNYYNGTEWFALCGPPAMGTIAALDCEGATQNGTLISGVAAGGVSSVVSYTGSNGGTYNGQTVTSAGVTGLTASLPAGTFTSGSGSLTYTITGTPLTTGTASFFLSIGGQSCELTRTVSPPPFVCGSDVVTFTYNGNPVSYGTVSGAGGTCWLDRNLGAQQVAQSVTDHLSYGDLFQWGRGADGHQLMSWGNSTTGSLINAPVTGQSASATPGSNFLIGSEVNWYTGSNPDSFWQGISGVNNPCPTGWRLPTANELSAERSVWSITNNTSAFMSPLKLPSPGGIGHTTGATNQPGVRGHYWSSDVDSGNSLFLGYGASDSEMYLNLRRFGRSVRCVKN